MSQSDNITILNEREIRELMLQCLTSVPDKRIERTKKYPLFYILFIALCTFITGGRNFYEMAEYAEYNKEFIDKITGFSPNTSPSHDTFNRIFKLLDPYHMNDLLLETVEYLTINIDKNDGIEHLACDGKYLRGSLDNNDRMQGILHIWSSKYGITICKEPINIKSNEITAIPKALEKINLKNCVVTFDSLNTQKSIIELIDNKNGFYLAPIKDNHSKAHSEIELKLNDYMIKNKPIEESCSKGHGRIETRKMWYDDDISWFQDRSKWKGLNGFVAIETERTDIATELEIYRVMHQAKKENKNITRDEATILATKTSKTLTCYLTNISKDNEKLLDIKLSHWNVETEHYYLDVIMGEDSNRTKDKNAAYNLSVMRTCALNAIKLFRNKNKKYEKRSLKSIQRESLANTNILESVIFGLV